MTPDEIAERKARAHEHNVTQYAKHREKRLTGAKAYYQEHKDDPAYQEKKRLDQQRWVAGHREQHNTNGKAWRDANLERSHANERAAAHERYWADPEKARAKGRADMAAAYARGRRQKPSTSRAAWLKWRYGITPEQWQALHDEQDGLCGICRGPQQGKRRLGLDHNHETGKVRGLLCDRCNLLVGKVETGQPVTVDRFLIEEWIARPGIGTGSKYTSPPGRRT